MLRLRQRQRSGLLLSALVGAAIAVSWPGAGNADEARPRERRSCAASFEKAQVLRESWKLRRAKAALLACAKPACGKVVYRECTKMLSQLENDIPSVVLSAKDDRGEPLVDVQVSMDGEVLTSHLDGRALSIDPGIHHFSFAAPNGVADLAKVPIVQGQRNRALSVELRQARPAAPPAVQNATVSAALVRSKPPLVPRETAPPPEKLAAATPEQVHAPASQGGSAAPYIVGGIGLAGLAGFGVLYAVAHNKNENLTQCWPTCPQSQIDNTKKFYLAADISLGAGLAALGIATYLFIDSKSSSEKPEPKAPHYVVGVEPSRGGFFATVSGDF